MLKTKPEHWTLEEWVEAHSKIKKLSARKTYHWKAYDQCNFRDKLLSIPVILITSLVSTTAVTNAATEENNPNINYIISGASLLITLLTSVNKYFNYAELKESHRQAAINYLRLRSELAEILTDGDSVAFPVFSKTYYNKFISVRENAPTLPPALREKMDKSSKNSIDMITEIIISENEIARTATIV